VSNDDRTPPAPDLPSAGELSTWAGRYRLEGEIARGGMGVVLRALDPTLNRPLAVKILLQQHAGRGDLERRFLEEAQVAGQLQHPGVPPIHDLGRLEDGRPFFAMKLIKGRTLAELLAEREHVGQVFNLPVGQASWKLAPQDLPRWLGVFEQVCQAVAYAHSKGVIHRDLKPSNVMVGAFGEVQVMDWGLAKVLSAGRAAEAVAAGEVSAVETARRGAAEDWTLPDTVVGTAPYMAPEQARGEVERVDERADVFGLGAILCVILTGQPPYRGPDPRRQARRADLADAFERLAGCGAEAELVGLARACLAAEPDERPRDAGAAAEAVRAYQRSVAERLRQAEVDRAEAQVQAREERKRRRLAVVLAAAGLLLVLAGGSGAWMVHEQRATTLASQDRADAEARGVLEPARRLLGEAWEGHDLGKLMLAKAEADRAVAIARSGGANPAVQQETGDFQVEAKERLARAEKNRRLLDTLLDVSGPRETRTYKADESGLMVAVAEPSADKQYAAAFRKWWDLEIDQGPDAAIVQRIQQEPAVVVQEVIAALDAWWMERRRKNRPAVEWRRLVRLADRLDRSSRRRQMRALLVRRPLRAADVAGLVGAWPPWPALWQIQRGHPWRRLQAMGGGVDPVKEPVLTVVLLAQTSNGLGDFAEAERLLRAALVRRPGQVVLLDVLGKLMAGQGRWAEAIECYRALRAVRPRLGVTLGNVLNDAGRGRESEAVLRELLRQQPSNPEIFFYLGNALYGQKKLVEAVEAFHKAIELKPDFPRTYNNLGLALLGQKKLVAAEAALRKAMALKPDYALAYNNLGLVLADQKKPAEAEAAYRKAIEIKPDFPIAYCGLGLALHDRNKLAEAEAAFRKAIELKPDFPQAYNWLGITLGKQQKPAEAEVALRKAIELKRDYAEAYANLGSVLGAQRKLAEAEAACRKAIALKKDFPTPYYNLGNALYHQNKPAEAEAAFRKAIALKKDYAEAYHNLGNALGAQQKAAAAEVAWRKAIALKKDFPEAYLSLGNALYDQRKLAEAEAAFRAAVALKQNNYQAYNRLGVVLGAQKKLAAAEAAFRHAIALKKDYAGAYNNLGITLAAQQKPAAAEAACRKAIALKKEFAEAYYNLGNALYDQGKLAEAEAAYRTAIALKKDYAEAYNNLGITLYDQKKLAAAVAVYRQAIALKKDYALAYHNLGDALCALKKPEEAEAVLRQAIAVDPNDPVAHNKLGIALMQQKRPAAAEAAFRKAIALKRDDAGAYYNLGITLSDQGRPAEAAAAYRQAIVHKRHFPSAYFNLGNALSAQKKPAAAEAAYRKTIALQPMHALAHAGLGQVLLQQGRFAQAGESTRRGLALLPSGHPLRTFVSRQLQQCEQLPALEKKLTAVLQGAAEPKDAAERLALAELCILLYQRKYAAAARLYAEAFVAQPTLADDLRREHRYSAACCTALAAAGHGEGAAKLNDKERARLRGRALAWLKADLGAWAKEAEGPAPQRLVVRQKLMHWQKDSDLAGVRDHAALAKLPAAERDAWSKLWAELDDLLKRVGDKK
jgi:serine/threonine-protein kinase